MKISERFPKSTMLFRKIAYKRHCADRNARKICAFGLLVFFTGTAGCGATKENAAPTNQLQIVKSKLELADLKDIEADKESTKNGVTDRKDASTESKTSVAFKSGAAPKEDDGSDIEVATPDTQAVTVSKKAAAPAAEPPTAKDIFEALLTYDVESIEKRIENMPPGTRYNVYGSALTKTTDPKRMAELYAFQGLAEYYATACSAEANPNKFRLTMGYSSALQRIFNGAMINANFYSEPEFQAAVKKVFAKAGISEKLALDFCERGTKHEPISAGDYYPSK